MIWREVIDDWDTEKVKFDGKSKLAGEVVADSGLISWWWNYTDYSELTTEAKETIWW